MQSAETLSPLANPAAAASGAEAAPAAGACCGRCKAAQARPEACGILVPLAMLPLPDAAPAAG